MTQPLYETQVYLTQTTATVLECTPTEGGFSVVLDQTVFFPEGGGQPGDVGTIDHATVTDTVWEDGTIVHRCSAPLAVGTTVTLSLDWQQRFDHMQQHSGEHILSYAYWHLFGAMNVGFHLNEQFGTIDLDRVLSADEIAEGVAFANRLIADNRPILCYTANVKQLNKKQVRKISQKGGDNPRVVEIEGADICTCCGTHVAHTGEIGCLMVTKAEKNRQGSRLTFLCGGRALQDYQQKTDLFHQLTTLLSTDGEQIPLRLQEMKHELQEIRSQLKEKKRLIFEWQAKDLLANRGDSPYVMTCLHNASAVEAKTLLNRLVEQEPITAIVVYTKDDALSFFCAANAGSKGQNCRTICDLLCGVFNGKGGGKPDFAQGGGKYTTDWQERAAMVLQQLNRMS